VQRGGAAVAAHVQTPPNRRVHVEEQAVDKTAKIRVGVTMSWNQRFPV
jgi:uncharacterized protein (DUF1501 family)